MGAGRVQGQEVKKNMQSSDLSILDSGVRSRDLAVQADWAGHITPTENPTRQRQSAPTSRSRVEEQTLRLSTHAISRQV